MGFLEENLTIIEMIVLVKLRNVDGYESMSDSKVWQQLESIFTTSSAPKPT